MTDYYLPLSSIVGSLGLDRIPLIGDALASAFQEAAQFIGVRHWRETWNKRDATIRGTAVWGHGDIAKDCGAFEIAFGKPVGGTAEFEFELSIDRRSLFSTAAELAEELIDVGDVSTMDGNVKAQLLFRADAPPIDFRLIVRGLAVRIRFHRDHLRKGQVVNGPDGTPFRIDALPPGQDDTAEIVFLPPWFAFDTKRGADFGLDDDQILEMPPLLVVGDGAKPYFGILVSKLKLDLSIERSISEALAYGYDETWRGIYFEEIAVFGMDQIFPALPHRADPKLSTDRRIIDAKHWFFGTDGLSGYLRIAFLQDEPTADRTDPANPMKRIFQGLSAELEFDRDRLVKLGGEVTLRMRAEFDGLGHDSDVIFGFSARVDPDGGLLLEAVARIPGPRDPKDPGLFVLKHDIVEVLLLASLLAASTADTDLTLPVLLISFLVLFGGIDLESISFDAIRVRMRNESLAGGELRWVDFVVDVRVKLALDLPLNYLSLPAIKTRKDHPITALVHGFRVSVMTNRGHFSPEQLGGRAAIELGFDSTTKVGGTPTNAVSFESADEAIIAESQFAVSKLAIGEWEQGLWFELSVRLTAKQGDMAYSAVPARIRVYFLTNGDIDHFAFQGLSFSLLVPRVIFARGEWSVGEVSTVIGRAMILGWGASLADSKDPKNWVYNVGFGMREQALPPPPDPPRVTSRMVSFDFETSSGIPTVIFPGTSLYGISGLYASNARPAIGDGTPAQWLTQHPTPYQVGIEKWEPAEGESGWAAGVVLGASADHGRPWNLKAGFVCIKPGPVLMLFGSANFLKQRRTVKDTNPASLSFYAALDLLRRELLVGVRYDKKIPDTSGRVLKLSIPGEVYIHGGGWHIYLGQDKPVERHITAEILGKFKISGYLMFDTAPIANLAELGIDVPGFAIATGARFAYEGGKKGGHYQLYFYLKAAAHAAVTLAEPSLFMIRASLAGGLVAKAWGLGFEFELSAEFVWIRPTPDYLHGLLKVTLDLPWPIPNLHLSIDGSRGDDGDGEPITGSLIDGLSMYTRSTQSSVDVTSELSDVPLDPVFSLAFKYPTRNGLGVPGSFNVSDGSASTFYFAGGDASSPRGYAITLDALTLWKDVGGARVQMPGPFPALWRPDPLPAAGAQPAARILELFAYEGIEASRFIGASADYVDWATQGFDRCPPSSPPQPTCYVFDGQPIGAIDGEQRVLSGQAPPLLVASIAEDRFAESVRRYYAATRTHAEIVATPVGGLASRAVRLPATNGVTPPVAAGDRLRLCFQRAEEATLLVLRYPGGVVRMRGWLGDRPVSEDLIGVASGVLGEDRFQAVTYTLKGPIDRVEIEVAHGPGLRPRQSLVLRVCLLYSKDVVRWNDRRIASVNWSTFWSDLLAQDAATTDALLLEPGTRYTLEVATSWAYLREDGSLGSPIPTTDSFSFTTIAADRPPAALRGPASALDESDWEVKTTPDHGALGVYRSRPIRLEFRDARTDKLFGAFGTRLALRLVDELGQDLFQQLEFVRENAEDLPEYQRAWRGKVLGLPCAHPGLEVLWSKGTAYFDSLLAAGRRYDATLVMLEATVTDLSTVDSWDALPVLYRFGFTTSRYESLAEHLASYAVYDEIAEQDPDLAALYAAIGSPAAGARVTDGALLTAALFDHLHLLPRDPPTQPELVRIWARSAGDPAQLSVIALLLDGPEPFVRDDRCQLAIIAPSSSALPVVAVDQQDGARTLLLLHDGAGLGVAGPGPLTVTLSAAYIGNAGPATEVATRTIAVPQQPPTLDQESAP